jgi:hypothetical protein
MNNGITFICFIPFVAIDPRNGSEEKIQKGQCRIFYPNKNYDLFIDNTIWEKI